MLYLPEGLPALETLRSKGWPVATYQHAGDSLPLMNHHVALLNLMPQKMTTELDFARVMAAIPERVQLTLVRLKGQTYKTTPLSHVLTFYADEDALFGSLPGVDRLVVTGAPLEQMPFEDVRYWPQLTRLMDWARTNVERTLYVCWGAQAGLYHQYGVNKHGLKEKMFGIFPQEVVHPVGHLMDGLSPRFLMPNSRHTEVRREEIERAMEGKGLVVAESAKSGVGIVAEQDLRSTYVVGHLEYEPLTLDKEYKRDLAKQLPIHAPENYYDEEGRAPWSWRTDALRFFYNWMCR